MSLKKDSTTDTVTWEMIRPQHTTLLRILLTTDVLLGIPMPLKDPKCPKMDVNVTLRQ